MATTLDHQEQEQLAELKAWWARWGTAILAFVLIGLLSLAGWNAWQYYKAHTAGQAAQVYDELQQALQAKDTHKVTSASGELIEHYAGTDYASLGALLAARAYHDVHDDKNARGQLEWVIDHGANAEFKGLARLRMAAILIDARDYEAAQKQLAAPMPAPLAASAGEQLGDLYRLQEKREDARKAWRDALSKVPAADALANERIKHKLEALGES